MRILFFAAALLSVLGFTQAAMACSQIEKVSAAAPEHVIKPGECIASSNARYRLTMQPDGVLTLSDERHPGHYVLWTATTGKPAVPGSSATLKNDGSLVVADPSGKETWRAAGHLPTGTAADYRGDFFLMVENSARVALYKGTSPFSLSSAVVWTSKTAAAAASSAPDANGDCQCHIRNSDGSPGHLSGEAFGTCGFQACFAICQSKRDYFGDPLMATYRHGSGTCKAF
jgi:hypothetical protein